MIARAVSWLGGVAWLVAWRVVRLVPERTAYALFERMSARDHRRHARRRAAIAALLEPVVGAERLDGAVRDAFRWYGRYWAETFRMQDLSSAELDRRFSVTGIEHIEKAYEAGTGAVLATPHLGNWDAGGRWVAERWPLTVVVEVLRPAMVFERFVAHRRALGMTIVPLERGADPTARCIETVRAGELVALVADRDLSHSGVGVTLFGRATSMPAGPAVIALRTGAPLIPAAIFQRDDGTWQARVLDPILLPEPDAPGAVETLTQRLADAFAVLIAEEPAQWHVFNRYWLDEATS